MRLLSVFALLLGVAATTATARPLDGNDSNSTLDENVSYAQPFYMFVHTFSNSKASPGPKTVPSFHDNMSYRQGMLFQQMC